MPKYDSKFEEKVAKALKGFIHHPDFVLEYTSNHTYKPDFIHEKFTSVVLEAKGRFRDRKEASKYVDIRRCGEEYTLIFIFQNPNAPMPGAKRRKKCGTKQTMAEWADRNGFTWYTLDTLPKEWRKR